MKDLIKYGFIAFVICCLVSCSSNRKGDLVMDENGVIYKLEWNRWNNEAYYLIEIDTTDYKAKFNNR